MPESCKTFSGSWKSPGMFLQLESVDGGLVVCVCVCGRLGEFAVTIVRDMILPNCVWRAGRTAAAIRKAAVACLWAVVSTPQFSTDDQVFCHLVPHTHARTHTHAHTFKGPFLGLPM